MALRQRIVKGTLVDGDGNPITSGVISFKPTKTLGYTSTHVVIDREFTVTTDSNGEFTATFWCDEDSLVAINYLVTFPVENSGQPEPQHFAVISLAYEDGSDKDIGTLIAESQPPPSEVPLGTWQSLIDGRINVTSLGSLGDVDVDPMSITDGDVLTWNDSAGNWEPDTGGGGGVSIGDAVGSGTAGSVLYVGSSNDLQQDNAGFQYDPSTNSLKLTAGSATDVPLVVTEASGATVAGASFVANTTERIRINATDVAIQGLHAGSVRGFVRFSAGSPYGVVLGNSSSDLVHISAAGEVRQRSSGVISWGSNPSSPAAGDVSMGRASAGILKVAGSASGGGLQFEEMSAPSAPATDNVVIYAEDNGSGKTRLMAQFATGAAVQIAIEP